MFYFAGTTFLVLYRSQEVPRFLSQPLSYIFFGFGGFFAPLGPPPLSEGALSWTGEKVFELFKSLKWLLWTRCEDDMVVGGAILGKFWGSLGDDAVQCQLNTYQKKTKMAKNLPKFPKKNLPKLPPKMAPPTPKKFKILISIPGEQLWVFESLPYSISSQKSLENGKKSPKNPQNFPKISPKLPPHYHVIFIPGQ